MNLKPLGSNTQSRLGKSPAILVNKPGLHLSVKWLVSILICIIWTLPARAEETRRLFDGRAFQFGGLTEVIRFGEDEIEGTDDDETRFAISLYFEGSIGEPSEFVPLADDIFGNYIRFSPTQAVRTRVLLHHSRATGIPEGGATEYVLYERQPGHIWQRTSHSGIPVASSRAFPIQPVEERILNSGDMVRIYPSGSGIMGFGWLARDEREVLLVRISVDRSLGELLSGDQITARLWNEVLRARVEEAHPDLLYLQIMAGAPQSRFDFRPSMRMWVPPFDDGTWPDIGELVNNNAPIPEAGIGRVEW